jgi:RHH-type transcriptional regulator, rel operon repressor / antitoxin RelB
MQQMKTGAAMTKTMISARIPEALDQKLEALAAAAKRSKSYLMEEALERFVERESWMLAKADAAFKEAQESGEWISQDAVETWLMSWGTDHVLPAPAPDIFERPKKS